jgi:hypothetical protein
MMPIGTGKSHHSILVKLTQEFWFMMGAASPSFHKNLELSISTGRVMSYKPNAYLPFSWKKPSRELQPGPPFNQMVTSSTGAPTVGWKTKKSSLDLSPALTGMFPEYISPKSKGTSGILVTWKAERVRHVTARAQR